MNSRFIIIAILILVKVVGVASRARAFDYFDTTSCYHVKQASYMIENLKFRCGKPVGSSKLK